MKIKVISKKLLSVLIIIAIFSTSLLCMLFSSLGNGFIAAEKSDSALYNLIKSGDFEDGTNGWTVPSGVTQEIIFDTEIKSNVARFTGSVKRYAISQSFAVEANSEYQLTYSYKKLNGRDTVDAYVEVDGANGAVMQHWINFNDKGVWAQKTDTIKTGGNTTLTIRLENRAGEAYIDNVCIVKKCKITVVAGEHGKAANNVGLTAAGSEITVLAAPDAGYTVDGWYASGKKISSDIRLKYTVASDVEIELRFKPGIHNAVENGDFENGLNNWTPGETEPEVVYDSESGSKVIHFKDSNKKQTVSQTIGVQPNTEYVISYRYKKFNDKSKVDGYLEISGAGGAILQHWINFNEANKWSVKRDTFNSGNNSVLRLQLEDRAGEVYIDEIKVSRKCLITATASEHGKLTDSAEWAAEGEKLTFSAEPDVGYMVEGWYVDGEKAAEGKRFVCEVRNNMTVRVNFDISTLPTMTAFETDLLYCREEDNIITDGGFESESGDWNIPSFIKDGVSAVEVHDGTRVLHFSPNGTDTEKIYIPVRLHGNTDYIFATDVKGKYYSESNHLDMTFGIMNTDGTYINLDNPRGDGYYDETPNMSDELSMTPPSWDNNWHRRGMVLQVRNDCDLLIAVSGAVSDAYLDNIMLCEKDKAFKKADKTMTAVVTNMNPPLLGCDEKDNLIKNYSFSSGEAGWNDAYGWNGMFSGLSVADSGNGNNSLFMSSLTGYSDHHYLIKWIDVKPDTSYTLSLAAASSSSNSDFGILIQGERFYSKLMSWNLNNDCKWAYVGVTVNSGNSDKIGFYIKSNERTTVVDEIRLFETSAATKLTNRLEGEVDLPDRVKGEENKPNDYVPDSSGNNNGGQISDDEKNESENTSKSGTKKILKRRRINTDAKSNGNIVLKIIIAAGCAVVVTGGVITFIIVKKRKSNNRQ